MSKDKIKLNIPEELEKAEFSHAETISRLESERAKATQVVDKLSEISDTLNEVVDLSKKISEAIKPIKDLATYGFTQPLEKKAEETLTRIMRDQADEMSRKLSSKVLEEVEKRFNPNMISFSEFSFYILAIAFFFLFAFFVIIVFYNGKVLDSEFIWEVFGWLMAIWGIYTVIAVCIHWRNNRDSY